MPLIADATGIEHQWVLFIRCVSRRLRAHGDQPRPTIRMIEPPVPKQARRAGAIAGRHRPWNRFQLLVASRAQIRQSGKIERARAVIVSTAQARVFIENLRGAAKVEAALESQALGHLAQHPPVGARGARHGQEGALTRNMTVRVRDRAVLFTPRRGG